MENKPAIVATLSFASLSLIVIFASALWTFAPPMDKSVTVLAEQVQSTVGAAAESLNQDAVASVSNVGNVYADGDDFDLNEAVREARDSQPAFERAFLSGEAGRYSFKILLSDGLSSKPVWIRLTEIIDNDYAGDIGETSQSLAFASKDNTVQIPNADIVDWMIQREDGIYGAYTTRVLLRRSPDPTAGLILKRIRDL